MSGSPDISNPKLVTSTKETAAAGTTREISPGLSSLSLGATTPRDQATVSVDLTVTVLSNYQLLARLYEREWRLSFRLHQHCHSRPVRHRLPRTDLQVWEVFHWAVEQQRCFVLSCCRHISTDCLHASYKLSQMISCHIPHLLLVIELIIN